MFEYITTHPYEIFAKTIEHIQLTIFAVCIAILVGVPLGILSSSRERIGKWVFAVINIIQTIPSLALFGFLIPLPFIGGIGAKPAITVLFLYALLPIVKNTFTGLQNIDKGVIESARGMGMTGAQRLWMVRVPIAFPIIMSGIRLSTVLTIGTVTIAAIIGAGGLGDFIYRGTATLDYNLIMAGTLPAIILAIMTDRTLEFLEKRLDISKLIRKLIFEISPRSLVAIAVGIVLSTLSLVVYLYLSPSLATEAPIRIGVKNITESRIIGETLKLYLEKHLKKPVVISNLSSTSLLFKALINGNIDLYMGYTGTVYVSLLKREDILPADQTLTYIRDQLKRIHTITVFDPLGFQNNFAFALRSEDVHRYGIRTLSELQGIAPTLRIGTTSECHDRHDGLRGLKQFYGFSFKEEKIMEHGIRYKAIANKDIDIIDAFTTDGFLLSQPLTALEDDRHFFPPYYAVLLARDDFLERNPAARDLLHTLCGKIDDHMMQTMNYQVDVEKKPIETIASHFLQSYALLEE